VHLKPCYDQAELVREAVRSVRDAMLIGATLASSCSSSSPARPHHAISAASIR